MLLICRRLQVENRQLRIRLISHGRIDLCWLSWLCLEETSRRCPLCVRPWVLAAFGKLVRDIEGLSVTMLSHSFKSDLLDYIRIFVKKLWLQKILQKQIKYKRVHFQSGVAATDRAWNRNANVNL